MPFLNKLTPTQIHLLRLSRTYGTATVVVAITAVSVALSLGATALSLKARPVDDRFEAFELGIALLIPLLVAPVVSVVNVRLLHGLAAAFEELHTLASTDALTGIANRRHYFERAAQLLGMPGDFEQTLIGMIDLDRFKQINDAHGHGIGDLALVRVAHRLQHAAGPYGVVGRVGGDEFALCLNVPAAQLPVVADALRAACTNIAVKPEVVINASLGLCQVTAHKTIDEAMRLADRALYDAKAANRRRAAGREPYAAPPALHAGVKHRPGRQARRRTSEPSAPSPPSNKGSAAGTGTGEVSNEMR